MLEHAGGPRTDEASGDDAPTGPAPGPVPSDASGSSASTVLEGRYRLDAVLARGGMSTVHRSRDLLLERDVAVKVVRAGAEDADDVLRARAEIRTHATLNHPGLVTLYDAGTVTDDDDREQLYLVMELVEGPTLAARLQRGALTAEQVAAVGRQLADALAAVHARGIVHRDLKPANVLLTAPDALDDGRVEEHAVTLADFGIARSADGTRLTATGMTLGTVSYLSPEQALGGELGPASDVYALGLVLIECATARPAFSGTFAEVASVRLSTPPSVPAELGPDLCALLGQMTRIDPEERPSAQDVAARLGAARYGRGGTLELPAAEPAVAGRRTRTTRLVAAGAIALLAVGAVVLGRLAAADPPTAPPPAYPTLEGTLGTSLTQLERSVEP